MENSPISSTPPPEEQSSQKTPSPNDLTGRILDDFQLIRRIGQGGMGQVYLARQLTLKRQVAVKILRADLAANEMALKRFKAEAEAVAQITHANIVQVYMSGTCGGLYYMALEYVEGRNLRDYIKRKGPPEVPIAINIMRQVAAALQRASELGFVHRDIKPENILMTRKGEVKVADFGLSRCFIAEEPLHITQSGVTMGTPLYMSPEQVQGHTVDPRSDIYSFGVSCYHMLSGEPPFRGQTPFEVALQHVQNEPPPLSEVRPDLPPELCAIVHRMMSKNPDDRHQTAREILRDLTRLKESMSTTQAQAALAQSGTSALTMSQAAPIAPAPAAKGRWRRWLVVTASLLGAASIGAAYHWKSTPHATGKPDLAEVEKAPNPAIAAEKELLRRLDSQELKSDVEPVNALLDLAMFYIREKRFADAMHLFTLKELESRRALVKAHEKMSGFPKFFYPFLSHVGTGIVLSYRDEADKSNAEFKQAAQLGAQVKVKFGKLPLDVFLWRYDRWKKGTADALDRNAKNLNVPRLPDDQLNRYRHYSKGP